MIRRRTFLSSNIFINLSLNVSYMSRYVIMDHLYFFLKKVYLFKNIRFFLKNFKHKWSVFLFSTYLLSWSKMFQRLKKVKKSALNLNFVNAFMVNSHKTNTFFMINPSRLLFNLLNISFNDFKISGTQLYMYGKYFLIYKSFLKVKSVNLGYYIVGYLGTNFYKNMYSNFLYKIIILFVFRKK